MFLAGACGSARFVLLLSRVPAQPASPVSGDLAAVHPEVSVIAGVGAQLLRAAMTGAFAARLASRIRFGEPLGIIPYGTVVANVVVVGLLGYIPAAVMESAADLVGTVPDHLRVVADHGRNVVAVVSKREVVVFKEPYFDGKKPGYLYI